MPSFKFRADPRRRAFLRLVAIVGQQLQQAYERQFAEGKINQTGLAAKLAVDKSVIHRRLAGDANMTLRSLADMAWALDHDDFVFELRRRTAAHPGNRPAKVEIARPTTLTRSLLVEQGERQPRTETSASATVA